MVRMQARPFRTMPNGPRKCASMGQRAAAALTHREKIFDQLGAAGLQRGAPQQQRDTRLKPFRVALGDFD